MDLGGDGDGGDGAGREWAAPLPEGGMVERAGRPGVLAAPGAPAGDAPGGGAAVLRPAAQVALRVRDALDAGREVWATVEMPASAGGGDERGGGEDDGDGAVALLSIELGGAGDDDDAA